MQEIIDFAKRNNGIVTSAMVSSAGFPRGCLKYLSDTGKLEKTARGVYVIPSVWEDEFVNIQNRFKKGIFSLETALFLWELTDRTPIKFHMTFPQTYNLTSPKNEGIICNSVVKSIYALGITDVKTPSGNTVKAYNIERTLCDILKKCNHSDIQIITDTFKQYVHHRDKNIPLLSEYSKILKVEKKLRTYLEVLLWIQSKMPCN